MSAFFYRIILALTNITVIQIEKRKVGMLDWLDNNLQSAEALDDYDVFLNLVRELKTLNLNTPDSAAHALRVLDQIEDLFWEFTSHHATNDDYSMGLNTSEANQVLNLYQTKLRKLKTFEGVNFSRACSMLYVCIRLALFMFMLVFDYCTLVGDLDFPVDIMEIC